MGITSGQFFFGLGALLAIAVCYIWFFIILVKGISSRNYKTRRFFVAAVFYTAVLSVLGYYFYLRINIDYFIQQAELQHSTTPLESLDSIRLGPVNDEGRPSFCLEKEGDPTKLGHRYCEIWTSPLAAAIVPAGGVFETGIGQIQRWRLVTASEECLDTEVASRDLEEAGRAHSYSGLTALRGMCYVLDNVEASRAKYLLTGAVKPLPFTPQGDYFELVLTNQETGEVVDRLVEVRLDISRNRALVLLFPFLPALRLADRDGMIKYPSGPIQQILKHEFFNEASRTATRPRLTWVEEIAATIPIDDDFAIEALERSEAFAYNYIYNNLVKQICKEWNFAGPDLRAEINQRAIAGLRKTTIFTNCGISNCWDGIGRDANSVQCENPRAAVGAQD